MMNEQDGRTTSLWMATADVPREPELTADGYEVARDGHRVTYTRAGASAPCLHVRTRYVADAVLRTRSTTSARG